MADRHPLRRRHAPPPAPARLSDGRLRGIADTLASAFAVYAGRNRLAHRTRMRHPVAVLAGRRLGAGFLTSAPELAALAALPQDLAVPGLDRARAKSMPAPVAIPTGGRGTKVLGDAEIGGHARRPDRHRRPLPHCTWSASTGSGKTTLLVNMAVDDIKAGRGTVVIDPHGDMVLDILDRHPRRGWRTRSCSSTPTSRTRPRSTPSRATTRTWSSTTSCRSSATSSPRRGGRGWTTSCASPA